MAGDVGVWSRADGTTPEAIPLPQKSESTTAHPGWTWVDMEAVTIAAVYNRHHNIVVIDQLLCIPVSYCPGKRTIPPQYCTSDDHNSGIF